MQGMSRQRGVSLIEVLVAVLVFSIGLIGLAGLMVMATRSNHAAYIRTQVIFLANSMANRMSANPKGMWDAAYNGTVSLTAPSSLQVCSSASTCSADQLATYDLQTWASQLKIFLPNPSATINCTNTGIGYTPTSAQLNFRPPYGGNCAMTIKWSEISAGSQTTQTAQGAALQTFAWNFQP
jgi:type IV pilus assembly protein PilV